MKNRSVILSVNEVKLFCFLWKWKVATTAVLARKFWGSWQVGSAYRRLWKIERAGYLQARVNPTGKKWIWMLTRKSFDQIKYRLPEMLEEGYLSENPYHDLVVASVHMGDWLIETPPGVEFVTEQQIRRFDMEFLPEGTPRFNVRRPDGYWIFTDGNQKRCVALEVELSLKKSDAYESIRYSYDYEREHAGVLWVVKTKSMATSIEEKMHKKPDKEKHIHSFILFDDFKELGWRAPIIKGKHQGDVAQKLLLNSSQSAQDAREWSHFFDLRKSPHRSKVCKELEKDDFAY